MPDMRTKQLGAKEEPFSSHGDQRKLALLTLRDEMLNDTTAHA